MCVLIIYARDLLTRMAQWSIWVAIPKVQETKFSPFGPALSKYPSWDLLVLSEPASREQARLVNGTHEIFVGWCDYIVCDAISCPEDLTAEFFAREKAGSDIRNDFDFGPSVGTEADPEFHTDDWV